MRSVSLLHKALLIPVILLLAAYSSPSVWAQDEDQTDNDTDTDIVADAFDRGTPRSTLQGFLTAAQDTDFESAAEYLDQRNLPAPADSIEGSTLAHALSVVLGRELWIDLDEINDRPEGASGDNLPAYRDTFGEITVGNEVVTLFLQRVPRGDGEFIWKISNRTVAEIPKLYAEFGYGPIEDRLRKLLPDITFLGVELYKWVVILGVGLLAYPLLYLTLNFLSKILIKEDSPIRDLVKRFLTGPFLWLLMLVIAGRLLASFGLGIEAQRLAEAHTLDIAITTWALFSATNLFFAILENRLRKKDKKSVIVILGPIGNAAKILLIIFAVLMWLSNLGFNITALLAGLGVGGIAIALALQKPLEDLFGAVSLYAQQPAKVGDYGKFGAIEGTVEEISLRSTRIRTLNNTLVSAPNSKVSSEVVENYSARQSIRYHPKITLRYGSSSKQLAAIITDIRDILTAHERVLADPLRVRLTDFAEFGIEIRIHAYVDTTHYAEFLGVAEELNFSIIDIVARSDIDFAVPLQGV